MTKQEILNRLEEIYKEARELTELADHLSNKKHKRGDRYVNKIDGEQYILAEVDMDKCSLISIDNGNRYYYPIWVRNSAYISSEEFEKITVGTHNDFEKIT